MRLAAPLSSSPSRALSARIALWIAICLAMYNYWHLLIVTDNVPSSSKKALTRVSRSERALLNSSTSVQIRRSLLQATTSSKNSTKSSRSASKKKRQNNDKRKIIIENKKPTLYLHVGPPKTATTFLQTTLCVNFNYTDNLLVRDNFVYLGTCPYYKSNLLVGLPRQFLAHHASSFFQAGGTHGDSFSHLVSDEEEELFPSFLPSLPANTKRKKKRRLSSRFRSIIEQTAQRGRNAILIFEGAALWNQAKIRRLASLLNERFNVQVIVAHRPFHEWLLSFDNQREKATAATNGDWSESFRPFNLKDPNKLSTLVFRAVEQNLKHPAHVVRDRYANEFDSVKILPLRSLRNSGPGDPLLEHFFCHLVKNATHTCQAVKQGNVDGTPANKNPSTPINHDLLAVQAYKQHLLPKGSNRQDVVAEIAAQMIKHNRTGDFPLICPSSQLLDRLEQVSLAAERNLFRTASHDHGFQRHTFCHIDAKATLQLPEWQDFFHRQRRLKG